MVGPMHPTALRVPLLSLIFVATSAAWVMGCSVPVFRYALERWAPDTFEATVFHRGGLDPAQRNAVRLLATSHANLKVSVVDLETEKDPARLEIWAEQETEELPWLYVTYPPAHPVAVELAAGPLEEKLAQEIVGSSLRKGIADQLVAGETTVWVLLEEGDQSRDDAAWDLLSRELERLESTLELPTIEQEDIDAGLIAIDENELKISFSAVRLSRENTEDEMLVRMLLDTEEDLIDAEGPMVFPVFGRGRVLYGLVGKGIAPDTIEAAAAYLVGSCSCQVKEDNPGVDVLMAMNWDDLVESTMETDRELPELAGILPDLPAANENPLAAAVTSPSLGGEPASSPGPAESSSDAAAPASVPAAGAANEGRSMLWTTLGALFLMLIAVAAGSAFFTTKSV